MFVFRILAVVVTAALAGSLLLWLFTGQQRYMTWAARLGKFALLAGGLFVIVLVAERFIAH